MNYAEMTDFEINREVAGKVGGFLAKDIFEEEQTIFKWHPGNKYSKFDPCNSWADAGPLIEKHGISLYRIDENDNPFTKDEEVIGLWFSCGPMVAGYGDPEPIKDGLSCSNKNPLRAAMITFLLMQEGK